ncbi:hypothetical protein M0813_13431 [Anaeramoeba flamelloides]|uniref:N-acetyltransferase domain-containing protein n=1 Tax=Anaeramoeba flamelloides TaxID=1746091 RepID=A0ABQ8Z960_9EUKA|nr:hypothetical protein M0813_13431 [Anaeramoeba flamelloides]
MSLESNLIKTLEFENERYLDIKRLTIDYLDQASDLTTNVFRTEGPVCSVMEEDETVLSSFIKTEVNKSLNQGIGVMAIDRETEKIVGCQLMSDCASTEEETEIFNTAIQKMEWNKKIFQKIMGDYFEENQFIRRQAMYIGFLSVHPQYRKMGLGRTLVTQAIKMSKEKGYERCCIWCTSIYSQMICQKLGFKIRKEISYQDLTVDGQYLWKNTFEKHKTPSTTCSELILTKYH